MIRGSGPGVSLKLPAGIREIRGSKPGSILTGENPRRPTIYPFER